MRVHRFTAIAAAFVLLPLLSGACSEDSTICKGLTLPSLLCPNGPSATGGSPAGMAACLTLGTSLWECNDDGGPNTVPLPVPHNHAGMCGSFYCASSQGDAQNQSGAAGNALLSCVPFSNDVPPPWIACITPCDACDDGQGGMLQSVGQNCFTYPGGGSNCCSGLACIDPGTGQPPPPNTGWEQAFCQGTIQCAQKGPVLVGLTTTRLRQIATQNNINGCAGQTGITQSRTIGLAFENWVLTTMGQNNPRNTMLFPSPLRQAQTGGLPGSVIPEYVAGLDKWFPAQGWSFSTQNMFFEVKAVTGVITQSTSNWQILGLIDVASRSFAADAGTHPPAALVFTTTGNTNLDLTMLQKASSLNVAVWQQIVMEDTNSEPNNPDLYIDQVLPANQDVYNGAVPLPMHQPWAHSPLTSPKSPPMPVPGDPDPPEVD
jgi:hypothetical protein